MKRISMLLLLASVLLSAAAMADTLELKDGRLIQGHYKGGTGTTLRFAVDGIGPALRADKQEGNNV